MCPDSIDDALNEILGSDKNAQRNLQELVDNIFNIVQEYNKQIGPKKQIFVRFNLTDMSPGTLNIKEAILPVTTNYKNLEKIPKSKITIIDIVNPDTGKTEKYIEEVFEEISTKDFTNITKRTEITPFSEDIIKAWKDVPDNYKVFDKTILEPLEVSAETKIVLSSSKADIELRLKLRHGVLQVHYYNPGINVFEENIFPKSFNEILSNINKEIYRFTQLKNIRVQGQHNILSDLLQASSKTTKLIRTSTIENKLIWEIPLLPNINQSSFNIETNNGYTELTDYLHDVILNNSMDKGIPIKNWVLITPDEMLKILKDESLDIKIVGWRAETAGRRDFTRGVFIGTQEHVVQAYLGGTNPGGYEEGGQQLSKVILNVKNPYIVSDKTSLLRILAEEGNAKANLLLNEDGGLRQVWEWDRKKQVKIGLVDPYPFKDRVIVEELRRRGYDAIIYTQYREIQYIGEQTKIIPFVSPDILIKPEEIDDYTAKRLKRMESWLSENDKKIEKDVINKFTKQITNKIQDSSMPKLEEELINGRFADNDLVYGISNGGELEKLRKKYGGRTLSSIKNVNAEEIHVLSKRVMDSILFSKEPKNYIHFFLDGMFLEKNLLNKSINFELIDILNKLGPYAYKYTSIELRYILYNWEFFQDHVKFYYNGRRIVIDDGIHLKPKKIDSNKIAPKEEPAKKQHIPQEEIIEPKLILQNLNENIFNIKETNEQLVRRVKEGFTRAIEVDANVLVNILKRQPNGYAPLIRDTLIDELRLVEQSKDSGIDAFPRLIFNDEQMIVVEGNHRIELARRLNKKIVITVKNEDLTYILSRLEIFGKTPTKSFKEVPIDNNPVGGIKLDEKQKAQIDKYSLKTKNTLDALAPIDRQEMEALISKYISDEERIINLADYWTSKGIKEELDFLRYYFGKAAGDTFVAWAQVNKRGVISSTNDIRAILDYHFKMQFSQRMSSITSHIPLFSLSMKRAIKDGYDFKNRGVWENLHDWMAKLGRDAIQPSVELALKDFKAFGFENVSKENLEKLYKKLLNGEFALTDNKFGSAPKLEIITDDDLASILKNGEKSPTSLSPLEEKPKVTLEPNYRKNIADILHIETENLSLPVGYKNWKNVYEDLQSGALSFEVFKEQRVIAPGDFRVGPVIVEPPKALPSALEPKDAVIVQSTEDTIDTMRQALIQTSHETEAMSGEAQDVVRSLNAGSLLKKIGGIANILSGFLPSIILGDIDILRQFSTEGKLAQLSENDIRLYYKIMEEYAQSKINQSTIPVINDGIIQKLYIDYIKSFGYVDNKGIIKSLNIEDIFDENGNFKNDSNQQKLKKLLDQLIEQYRTWLDSAGSNIIKEKTGAAPKTYNRGEVSRAIRDNPFFIEKNSNTEVWEIEAAFKKVIWMRNSIIKEATKWKAWKKYHFKGLTLKNGQEFPTSDVQDSKIRNLLFLLGSNMAALKAGDAETSTLLMREFLEETKKIFDDGDKSTYPLVIPWELQELTDAQLDLLKEAIIASVISAIATAYTGGGLWLTVDILFNVQQLIDARKKIKDLPPNATVSPKPNIGNENKYIDFLARIQAGESVLRAAKAAKITVEEQPVEELIANLHDESFLMASNEEAVEFLAKTRLISEEEIIELRELIDKYHKGKLVKNVGPFKTKIYKGEIEIYEDPDDYVKDRVNRVLHKAFEQSAKRREALVKTLKERLEKIGEGKQSLESDSIAGVTSELDKYVKILSEAMGELASINKLLKNFSSLSVIEKLNLMAKFASVGDTINRNKEILQKYFDALPEETKKSLGIYFDKESAKTHKPSPNAPEPTVIDRDDVHVDEFEELLQRILNRRERILHMEQEEEVESIEELEDAILDYSEPKEYKPIMQKKPDIKPVSFVIEPLFGAVEDTFSSSIYVKNPNLGKKSVSPANIPVVADGMNDGIFDTNLESKPKHDNKLNIKKDENKKSNVIDAFVKDLTYYVNFSNGENRWITTKEYLIITHAFDYINNNNIINKISSGAIKSKDDLTKSIIKELSNNLLMAIKENKSTESPEQNINTPSYKLNYISDILKKMSSDYYISKQKDEIDRNIYNEAKKIWQNTKALLKQESKIKKKEAKEIKKLKKEREKYFGFTRDAWQGKRNSDKQAAKKAYNAKKKDEKLAKKENQKSPKEKWKKYVENQKKKGKDVSKSNIDRQKYGVKKTNGDSAGCKCSKCKKLMDAEIAAKAAADALAAAQAEAKKAAQEAAKILLEALKKAQDEAKLAEEQRKEEERKKEEEDARNELKNNLPPEVPPEYVDGLTMEEVLRMLAKQQVQTQDIQSPGTQEQEPIETIEEVNSAVSSNVHTSTTTTTMTIINPPIIPRTDIFIAPLLPGAGVSEKQSPLVGRENAEDDSFVGPPHLAGGGFMSPKPIPTQDPTKRGPNAPTPPPPPKLPPPPDIKGGSPKGTQVANINYIIESPKENLGNAKKPLVITPMPSKDSGYNPKIIKPIGDVSQ